MITYSSLGRSGRFANQVFQVAGTIAIANRSGQPFAFPEWKNWDALERFRCTEDIDVHNYFVNPLPRLPEDMPGFLSSFKSYPYFWGYAEINLPQGNWDLSALHFQSMKYWEGQEDLIRYYLTMKDEPEYSNQTAVHIRKGDYSGWNTGYHPQCSVDYYRKAVELIEGPYLLFSDDLFAASKMMDEIGVKYDIFDKGYLESFAKMKRCKNFITANSSFSLAPAWLSNQEGKKIASPGEERWFGTSFGPSYQDMAKDLYAEGTIKINL